MFEMFYISRALDFLEQHPRVIGGIVAYITVSEIQANITRVKLEKIKTDAEVKTAETNLECERIRLETAKIEAQNRTTS